MRFGRHLRIAEVQAEILIAIRIVAEQIRLGERSHAIPHEPARRCIVDLAHQLISQPRFTDAPLRDDRKDVRKLFRLVVHQVDKVLELFKEIRLAHDRMRQRITRHTTTGPLVHFFVGHAAPPAAAMPRKPTTSRELACRCCAHCSALVRIAAVNTLPAR